MFGGVEEEEDEAGPRRTERLHAMASEVSRRARDHWRSRLDRHKVHALLQEAFAVADVPYTAEVAAAWGEDNFPGGIPTEVVEAHEEELRATNNDFDEVVRRRLERMRPDRLNGERVHRLDPGNPERERLLDLAEGIMVETPPGFYPNGQRAEERPPLRHLYKRTHKAVDKMIYDLVQSGLALVLTAATAYDIGGLHVSPAHWAPKAGKAHGRPLIDSTDANSPYPVLNSAAVSKWAQEYFGEIRHPTIIDFVLMIWDFKQAHPEVTWDQVVLFKMDLKGAYNLLSFKARFCKLFSVELVGGLVVIFLCGLFGWSATPAAFQVVTRAIVYELRIRLFGDSKMYVDDILAVTLLAHLVADKTTTRNVCNDLLGAGAIADEKTVDTELNGSRRIDVIGYTIDMRLQVVTLSHRNLLRTLYAFFKVDTRGPIAVVDIQRMASLASRYCFLLPELRPFSRALYGCIRGIRNRRVSVPLTPAARLSVELWRTLLCAIALDERRFARPFHTFVPREAETVIQFDASLQGIGILLYERDRGSGDEVLIGGTAVPFMGWEMDEEDSSMQNTAEFMAVVVGIVTALRWLPSSRDRSIMLRGDSVTALQWAASGRIRSDNAARAACVFALLLAASGARICGSVHVPAELNGWCDLLSRRDPAGRYREVQEVIPGTKDLHMQKDAAVKAILKLCDPRKGPLDEGSFEEFWREAGVLVDSVCTKAHL